MTDLCRVVSGPSPHAARSLVLEKHGDALPGDAEELGDLLHGVAVGSEGGRLGLAEGCADIMQGFDVGGDECGDARGRFGFDDLGEPLPGFEAGEEVVDPGLDLLGAIDVGLGHVVELAEYLYEAPGCRSSGLGGHEASLGGAEQIVNAYCRNGY